MDFKNHYLQHALNHSPSKASYTFSKSERFKESPNKNRIQAIQQKHQQNIPKRSLSKKENSKSPNYRYVQERNKRVSPGVSSPIMKKSIGKYKSYKNKKNTSQYEAMLHANKQYRYHDNTSPVHRKMGGWPESKNWFNKSRSPKPQKSKSPSQKIQGKGRGREENSRNPYQNKSKSRSKSPLKIKVERQNTNEEIQFYQDKLGPGSYNIQQKKIGQYIDSRYKNNTAASFGRMERMQSKQAKRLKTLGPGTYNTFSQFGL